MHVFRALGTSKVNSALLNFDFNVSLKISKLSYLSYLLIETEVWTNITKKIFRVERKPRNRKKNIVKVF
jgi:hypothetical protein